MLLVVLHHIVADGWSLGVLFRELQALYAAETTGEPADLMPLALQYRRLRRVAATAFDRCRARPSHGVLASATDPASRDSRPAARSTPSARNNGTRWPRPVRVSPELTSVLARVGAQENATLFVLLLSAYLALLHRYTGQDDLCVGTPVANRTRQEVEPLIGCFVNTLAIRAKVSGDLTFRQLVQRTRDTAIDAQVHQDLPFELLVDALQIPRSADRSRYFRRCSPCRRACRPRSNCPA